MIMEPHCNKISQGADRNRQLYICNNYANHCQWLSTNGPDNPSGEPRAICQMSMIETHKFVLDDKVTVIVNFSCEQMNDCL